MLTIRTEQLRAFGLERIRQFRQKLLRHLNEVAPECSNPEWQVERGMADAEAFGLVSEQDVARFIATTCTHLGGFPSGRLPKPALAILMTYGDDPSRKLDRYARWALSNGFAIQ